MIFLYNIRGCFNNNFPDEVIIKQPFLCHLILTYFKICSNLLLGALQSGHTLGGSSPSWMYPHTIHIYLAIVYIPFSETFELK